MQKPIPPLPCSITALSIFAWIALCWTFRGQDGPFLLSILCVFPWLYLTYKNGNRFPYIPKGISVCSAIWAGYLLYLLIRAFYTSTTPLYESYFDWFSLLLFIPNALLLFERRSHLPWLLLTPAFAVVARIIGHTAAGTWKSDLFGTGLYGFGLHHVPFGMQAFFSLIILIVVGPSAIRQLRKHRIVMSLLLLSMAALITQALLRCGSRAGLIALMVGILTLLWMQRHRFLSFLKAPNGKTSLVVALALLTTSIYFNADNLSQRFSLKNIENAQLSFDFASIPRDKDLFLSRRLHLSVYGIQQWQSHPMQGHGPGSPKALLATDRDFHIHKQLHNMYVQTLVELGVIGTLIWAFISLSVVILVMRQKTAAKNAVYNQLFWSLSIAMAAWSIQSAAIASASWRLTVIYILSLGLLNLFLNNQPKPSYKSSE